MEITLAKALTVKKQLVQKLNDLQRRLLQNNSINIEEAWIYNPTEVNNELFLTMTQLIDLKSRIQAANVNIAHDILKMAELKNYLKIVQQISPRTSVNKLKNIDGVNLHVEIPCLNWKSRPELDKLFDNIRKQISDIQDKINEYNNKTKIAVPFEI